MPDYLAHTPPPEPLVPNPTPPEVPPERPPDEPPPDPTREPPGPDMPPIGDPPPEPPNVPHSARCVASRGADWGGARLLGPSARQAGPATLLV
jgi:hypothetical protein